MHFITIKDETIGGDILNEIKIRIDRESIKVKDLIASRVTAEVDAYNDRLPEYYNGLVKPSDAEQTLNGYKMKNRKKVDAEKQVYIALEAFQSNGFFILVDDTQCEDLEQEVLVNENTSISFLKLTPLIGG
ncbi:hypothetical protein GCM10009122_02900 [Fulvivirga kasyanovii]|uniref:Uncharacterized protein n=1 Tax=Fulvivirga kasyanovii TaxID=396812 RepID=A0ABW9RU42_9BACT|nr:hypothetical protein [Fulvivirga kasyanovii]MTI26505.1 hypothetical protein [Fulvivirga kasyanovii]